MSLYIGPDVNTTSLSPESESLLDLQVDTTTLGTRADPNYRMLAALWLLFVTAIRMVFVAPLPLGNGEAYYASWSRFVDWSYYDHPPFVSWMVRVTTAVLGSSPAAVRFGPVVAAAISGLLIYCLTERLFRPRAAFMALVLVSALPVFLVSSFVLNPEAPLAPFWVGYLIVIEGMRERDDGYRPLLAGALLGLGFLSKYTALLLLPATLLYFVASQPMRRWLRRPSFYAGGAVALLLATPVIAWNQARNWPSLRLHLVERAGVSTPVPGENTIGRLVEISSNSGVSLFESALRLLTGQLMVYSPLLLPLIVLALVRSARRARSDDRELFLTAFGLPVLAFLFAVMVKIHDSEQHWTMMGFVPGVIAAGHYADETWERAHWGLKLGKIGVAVTGVLFLFVNLYARSDGLVRLFPSNHYDPRADTVNELIGWNQVRSTVAHVASSTRGPVVLASNHYSLCGRLLFEMGDEPPVYCPSQKQSAYDFFGRGDPPADATVLALTNDIHSEIPARIRDRACVLADETVVERSGRRVAHYSVYTCPPVAPSSGLRASR